MGSMIDFIVPNVIVGLLILTIFGVHAMMIDSSVETRVTYDLQSFADTGVQVIQEHVRELRSIEAADNESIMYTTVNNEQVRIFKSGDELLVSIYNPTTGESNDTHYALRLADLQFSLLPVAGVDDALLRVQIQTESRPDMEVGQRTHRYRAYANRDIYLRNMHLN